MGWYKYIVVITYAMCDRLHMKAFFCCALILLIMGLAPKLISDAEGQTSTTPSISSQSLAPQNLQGGPQIASPGFAVPATVTTGQTTSTLTPTTGGISRSTTMGSFSSVGRGLPGMPGGPRMGSSGGGALDPSSTYMAPPVVGPLFCDP